MKIDEQNFIKCLKKRNEDALRYVIKEYGWLVKIIVSKQLYNLQHIQEECINDIFLSIWENIDKFDAKRGTFKNWVIGVSKYRSIDYKRKYIKDLNNTEYDSLEIGIPDNSDIRIIEEEAQKDIESLLSCLNEKDRDIFIKHFMQDMNASEIATKLGVTANIIYNRIYRGKKKIREAKGFVIK
ncbi:sigma-70 family RNA polymerase sigma factor [Clostridium sp. SHJSY1]|uniref:sigma-70 family RNA polymerase sigma factor n=1 Tax=Clostridium sp. SHJSY1 TaxID=2942483 RepID=UPI0028768396|nr:sigma-70 family RNA polymerase sigma factor [Clostridium sp. SHJSY1]MDS0525505.1 sigma-70 family RNA polymerase sigma factor [Clostridium sp. SHJSY1]